MRRSDAATARTHLKPDIPARACARECVAIHVRPHAANTLSRLHDAKMLRSINRLLVSPLSRRSSRLLELVRAKSSAASRGQTSFCLKGRRWVATLGTVGSGKKSELCPMRCCRRGPQQRGGPVGTANCSRHTNPYRRRSTRFREASRLRRSELGVHHHFSAQYLHQYANGMASREDHRRKSNGEQFTCVATLAMAHPSAAIGKAIGSAKARCPNEREALAERSGPSAPDILSRLRAARI